MVKAEIVVGILAVVVPVGIYLLNRAHRQSEKRERDARLQAIRGDLATAAYDVWDGITSAYGVNRDQGTHSIHPGTLSLHHVAMDLTAWDDHAEQYRDLADPIEYRFARQVFDKLREVVDAPLPHGLQRTTPSSFVYTGDWVEGCQTMAVPMTECHAIGAGTLFQKIADYLDLVDDGRTILLDYYPRIWIPHPGNPRWAIPYEWKELYATGYYQHHNEPDGRAKPIPGTTSLLSTIP